MSSIMLAVFYRKTGITAAICLADWVNPLLRACLITAVYGYPIITSRSYKPKRNSPVIVAMDLDYANLTDTVFMV